MDETPRRTCMHRCICMMRQNLETLIRKKRKVRADKRRGDRYKEEGRTIRLRRSVMYYQVNIIRFPAYVRTPPL